MPKRFNTPDQPEAPATKPEITSERKSTFSPFNAQTADRKRVLGEKLFSMTTPDEPELSEEEKTKALEELGELMGKANVSQKKMTELVKVWRELSSQRGANATVYAKFNKLLNELIASPEDMKPLLVAFSANLSFLMSKSGI